MASESIILDGRVPVATHAPAPGVRKERQLAAMQELPDVGLGVATRLIGRKTVKTMKEQAHIGNMTSECLPYMYAGFMTQVARYAHLVRELARSRKLRSGQMPNSATDKGVLITLRDVEMAARITGMAAPATHKGTIGYRCSKSKAITQEARRERERVHEVEGSSSKKKKKKLEKKRKHTDDEAEEEEEEAAAPAKHKRVKKAAPVVEDEEEKQAEEAASPPEQENEPVLADLIGEDE